MRCVLLVFCPDPPELLLGPPLQTEVHRPGIPQAGEALLSNAAGAANRQKKMNR